MPKHLVKDSASNILPEEAKFKDPSFQTTFAFKRPRNFHVQLENFIDTIPGSLYWKDRNGIYLGCNKTVLIKGHLNSKADIVGKTDYDVWPASADVIRKNDLDIMENDKTIEIEESILLKNGEQLYFSSVKSPLKDELGQIIGVIGNSTDITKFKKSKQQAEIASLAKTQFLALMSHELRTPLASIISMANMLRNSEISPSEVQEFSHIIENSGNYLLTTIDSILDFAKLEANKLEIIPIIFDLKRLVEEVINILRSSAQEKSLELFVFFDPSLPATIICDPRVIRHILTNLVGNAIKYTEKGYIMVEVHATTLNPQSVTLEFIVKDTGIGIPHDKLEAIFDKFSQVESPYIRKSSRQGTGLGLSIVRKLVDLLKGEIKVKSNLGEGSVFTVMAEFFTAA